MISNLQYSFYDEDEGIDYVLLGQPGAWILSMNGQAHLPLSDEGAEAFIEKCNSFNEDD